MNALDFFLRLKMTNKGGAGLTPRRMRDSLLSEYMGPEMHAKLHQVHRARRKKGG